ncbi:PhnA domain-containing protein [Pseudoalteromonas sp. YIC-827]|uniref:PhnA domain-containing protein n=1 Tax=Pseudoalteromonas qingdaonensis TaxID=3131913 RepID=A0ABU9MV97_9GAMM
MSIEQTLRDRSNNQCELCASSDNLSVYAVPPEGEAHSDKSILVCGFCAEQLQNQEQLSDTHWHCLNDSMWSQVPAVQVVAWRLLNKLSAEHSWAGDMLDMLYLDEQTQQWAEAAIAEDEDVVHLDSNGVRLAAGDTVTLIKDLDVKGSSLVAKRGTAVRNIGLTSNPEHIEGRVEGQRIVILTKFVKK